MESDAQSTYDKLPGFIDAQRRVVELAERLKYLEREVELTRISLREAWAAVPAPIIRSEAEIAVEAKHDRNALRAAKGDTAVASILKDLIYGA